MPLFRKSYGQLTWDDLKDLLDREVPENELLDYKRSMPDDIESTMAAMANSYGGDIIIGVSERAKNDGRPEPADQVRGVENAEQLKHSIEQKNFSIHPPVIGHDVQVVPVPQNSGRGVVVVRIQQSDLVPHWVVNRGHFVRAGSHRRPYRDAHLGTERIVWLRDRRQRHIEFRDDLLNWMDELHGFTAWHKVWCVPQFPSPDRRLWEGVESSLARFPLVRDKYESCCYLCPHFPSEFLDSRAVQHGLRWHGDEDMGSGRIPAALEHYVDDHGLIGLRSISQQEIKALKEEGETGVVMDWTIIATHLLGVSRHAAALYGEAGYNGPVQFGVEIGQALDVPRFDLFFGMSDLPGELNMPRGIRPVIWGKDVSRLSAHPMASRGRRVRDTHECLVSELATKVRDALAASKWTRAFGHRLNTEETRGWVSCIESAFVETQSG